VQAVRRPYAKAQLFGVDLSEHSIGHCNARQLRASITQASAEKLPFASDTFDYVLSIDVLTATTPAIRDVTFRDCNQDTAATEKMPPGITIARSWYGRPFRNRKLALLE
jgi:hypothetical protein